MTTLDKDLPYATHLGRQSNGVKFSQAGYGFDNSGQCLGKIVNGKLEEITKADTKSKEIPKTQVKKVTHKAKPAAKAK